MRSKESISTPLHLFWVTSRQNQKTRLKSCSQVVRETMRRRTDDDFDFRVVKDGNEARISINAIQKDGQFRDKLEPQVRVIGPNEAVSDVTVHQVGPGSYAAKFPLSQKGSYLF